MTLRFTKRADFRSLAKRSPAAARGSLLQKSATVSATVTSGRTISFVCSTPAKDRDGDTLKQAGWKLDNYKRNPVVMWAHRTEDLPIARARNVRVESGLLKAGFEFVPADVPIAGPIAEGIYQLYAKGFLAAVSVGFQPIDWRERGDDVIDFLQMELFEISCVPIPSNTEATIDQPSASSGKALDRARLLARYYALERAYAL